MSILSRYRAPRVLAAIILASCARARVRDRRASVAPAPLRRSCIESPWTAAQDLRTTRDRPIYVERPAVASLRGGQVLLLGFPTFVWASRDRLDPHGTISMDSLMPAGVVLDTSGRVHVLPYPGGSYTRLWTPRLAVDSTPGVWGIDVFYAARGSAMDDLDVPPTSIWHSRFDGSSWSAPERLFADTVEWGPASASEAIRNGDTLTVATSTAFKKGWDLLLIQRVGGTWIRKLVRRRGSGYLSLAATPAGLVLARVRAEDRQGLNGNSLFVARSADGGSLWTDDQVVHRAGDGEAHEPQLLARGDSVWLLWRQTASGRAGDHDPDSLAIAVSSDQGRTWQRRPGIAIHERSAALTTLLAPNGGIHAAYLADIGARRVIGYAYWDSGAWRRVDDMPGPAVVTPPMLAIVHDSLWLLRGRMGEDVEGNSPILTIARRSLHCPSA